MRSRRPALAVLLLAALTGGLTSLAACGDTGALPDPAPETTPSEQETADYRLSVHSSQGATNAIPSSLCGRPSTRLVVLPCGVSLGFARANAPRLPVGRRGDRLFLELNQPATAIFTSLGTGVGERGLQRQSTWIKLAQSGRSASVGYTQRAADYPTVAVPTFLSVLVVFDGDMPVPTPAPDGTPDDAVVRGATAEYLVQLAAQSKDDQQ